MTVKYDNEIDALLNAAEQYHQCLARPKDKHLMRALAYRSNHAKPRLLLSPHCGVYVRRTYWKGLSRRDQVLHVARAIAQLHPKWIFDSYTAAAIRGWNVSYELLDKLNILAPYQIQTKTIISRSAKHPAFETVDGLRVSTVPQTLHHCLRAEDLRISLPIADSALRETGKSKGELIELVKADPTIVRSRDFQRTIDVLTLADSRSESGGESIARATMIMLGFAVPDLQVECRDPMNPSKVIRVDFYWVLDDGTIIIGELDGRQKYIDPTMTKGKDLIEVLTDERLRESRLSVLGARIVRFSYSDVLDTVYFARLLERYGVPRNTSGPFVSRTMILPPIRAGSDDVPPLECYADLIASYERDAPR